jgi:hypothetical protein
MEMTELGTQVMEMGTETECPLTVIASLICSLPVVNELDLVSEAMMMEVKRKIGET